jgi:hypothetical protein
MRVHQEHVAVCKVATALPIGKRAATVVAFERLPHINVIDRDLIPDTTDGLTSKRQHAFDKRHPARARSSFDGTNNL